MQTGGAARDGSYVARTHLLGERPLEPVGHGAEREPARTEGLDAKLLLPLPQPRSGKGDLLAQDPGVGAFSAYSSQRDQRSSRPRTTSKKVDWIAFVTGPGGPISWSSIDRTGVTSAAVPHMKI